MPITLRSTKGSALTHAELDANFSTLQADINAVSSSNFNGDYNNLINTPIVPQVLDDLSDVTITPPSNGEVLQYNGSTFVNSTISYAEVTNTPVLATVATTGTLSSLTDVATPTAGEDGFVLFYDNATSSFKWKVSTLSAETIEFTVHNDSGGVLTKGEVVYISGLNGNTPEVSKAQSNSSTTMPAFGIVKDDIANNTDGTVITFGSCRGHDASDFGETGITFALGDTLYVSATEAGKLTNVAPAGESNLIQNIGKIERATPTTNMTIKVGGAGRTNATPNLDTGNIFIGDAQNRSSTMSFATALTTYGGGLGSSITDGTTTLDFDGSNNLQLDNHFLPTQNIQFDLGSPTQRWRDIYLSSNTIHLGTAQLSYNTANGEWDFGAPINAQIKLSSNTGLDVNDNLLTNYAYNTVGYDNTTSNTKGGFSFNAGPVDGSGIRLQTVDQVIVWEARLDGIVRQVGSGGLRLARNTTAQLTALATQADTDLADADKISGTLSTETNGANGLIAYNSDTNKVQAYENGSWVNVVGGGSTSVSVPTQSTAPGGASDGDLWWDDVNGKLKIYYDDGVNQQWVDASPAGGSGGSGGGSASNLIAWDLADTANSKVLDAGTVADSAWYYGDVVSDPANPATSVVLDISAATFTGNVMGEVHGDVKQADGSTLILDVDAGVGTAMYYGDVTGDIITESVQPASSTTLDPGTVLTVKGGSTSAINSIGGDLILDAGSGGAQGGVVKVGTIDGTGVTIGSGTGSIEMNSVTNFNANVDFESGSTVDFTGVTVTGLSGGGGSGLQSRSTATGTTSSLADAAEADLDITGFKSYALLTITTDRAARVRLYVSDATRLADASRAEGVDPTSDAGLIAEVITTGADTVIISPGAYGFNLESSPTTTIPCRVTNKSGGASTVQVDLNILQLEA